ncbi:hypothetical protein E2C01_099667 [Portunus trituberculatus]|uniref:Uncharacterized protein n=1 Tax=Portunus trituberculatus TaxID=210409 RepID=A0A5B7K0W6_PORTR|nr:hypothetical protein [Portunus trituberculatus]
MLVIQNQAVRITKVFVKSPGNLSLQVTPVCLRGVRTAGRGAAVPERPERDRDTEMDGRDQEHSMAPYTPRSHQQRYVDGTGGRDRCG